MQGTDTSLTELDELLFDCELLRIGRVTASPDHPSFNYDGPVKHHALQFYLTSVGVRKGKSRYMADCNTVCLFSPGDEFTREVNDPEGERSFWIAFDLDSLMDAMGMTAREITTGNRVFRTDYLLISEGIFARHLDLAYQLDQGFTTHSRLEAKDKAIELTIDVFEALGGSSEIAWPGQETNLIEDVRELIARNFSNNLSITDIGNTVGLSPFHLARLFRRLTGTTIHQYRNSIRLKHALKKMQYENGDLSRLALELGFNSHSHFCYRFKRAFGLTPTAYRHRFH